MLKLRYKLDRDVLNELIQHIDHLQNYILRLRLGSMMLEGMDFLGPSEEEFFDMMEAYFLYAKTHVAKEFREIILSK